MGRLLDSFGLNTALPNILNNDVSTKGGQYENIENKRGMKQMMIKQLRDLLDDIEPKLDVIGFTESELDIIADVIDNVIMTEGEFVAVQYDTEYDRIASALLYVMQARQYSSESLPMIFLKEIGVDVDPLNLDLSTIDVTRTIDWAHGIEDADEATIVIRKWAQFMCAELSLVEDIKIYESKSREVGDGDTTTGILYVKYRDDTVYVLTSQFHYSSWDNSHRNYVQAEGEEYWALKCGNLVYVTSEGSLDYPTFNVPTFVVELAAAFSDGSGAMIDQIVSNAADILIKDDSLILKIRNLDAYLTTTSHLVLDLKNKEHQCIVTVTPLGVSITNW